LRKTVTIFSEIGYNKSWSFLIVRVAGLEFLLLANQQTKILDMHRILILIFVVN